MNTWSFNRPFFVLPTMFRRGIVFPRGWTLRLIFWMVYPTSVLGQPSNDSCGNGLFIVDGDIPFNTFQATTDGRAHVDCGFPDTLDQQVYNDIWFNYFASCTGTVTLSTTASAFDTRLAVYNGIACPATSAALVRCDDNGGPNVWSRLEFPAFAGAMYKIRVGGANLMASGPGLLTVECLAWQSHVYKDGDGDGLFEHIGSYAVDPDVALAAYAASPNSQSGTGAVFAYNTPGPTQAMGFGSGLESFMASQYPPAPGGSPDCPRCDLNVGIETADFGCPDLSCNFSLSDCNDYIHAARPRITCNDNPPCPTGKKCHACDAIVFFTTNVKPCNCISYPEGTFCEPSTETLYNILISRLPLCTCVEPQPIKILISGSAFQDCPFPVPVGEQTAGDGPVPTEAFQGMIPWGSNGYKYGGCHENISACKITSIKMTLTSPCDTFDTTSNGDEEFPMTVISADRKSIEFKGGSVQPGQVFYSRVPLSKGSFPAPGNPNKPRGTYLGQACPGKPAKEDAPAESVPNSPESGNDSVIPEKRPRGEYEEEFQVIRFDFGFASFARYTDGTTTRFNNENESIINASIFVNPMVVLGPSATLPGAFKLGDSSVNVVSGPNNFLMGGLTHALLIPDASVPGFDSVIQANVVWAQKGATVNSRFMDEFLFPPSLGISQTMVFRSNLFGATNNLTVSGEFSGEVTFKNTFPLPSQPIPAMSEYGMIVLLALICPLGAWIAARSRRVQRERSGS